MPKQWTMPAELVTQLRQVTTALNDFLVDQRDAFDGKSDAWADSDTGVAVDSWLDDLGNLADLLDNVEPTPSDLN